MCQIPSCFRFRMCFASMKYFSNDLREVRSVWCVSCGLVVKNDVFRAHVKKEHNGFHYRTIDKLVEEGFLELNYQSYHLCYYCSKQMIFTEAKIIGHLRSNEHKKFNVRWSQYRDQHLTHRGDALFEQVHVGSSGMTWEDMVVNHIKLQHQQPQQKLQDFSVGSVGFHPRELLPHEMEMASPSPTRVYTLYPVLYPVVAPWMFEDERSLVEAGAARREMKVKKPSTSKQVKIKNQIKIVAKKPYQERSKLYFVEKEKREQEQLLSTPRDVEE